MEEPAGADHTAPEEDAAVNGPGPIQAGEFFLQDPGQEHDPEGLKIFGSSGTGWPAGR